MLDLAGAIHKSDYSCNHISSGNCFKCHMQHSHLEDWGSIKRTPFCAYHPAVGHTRINLNTSPHLPLMITRSGIQGKYKQLFVEVTCSRGQCHPDYQHHNATICTESIFIMSTGSRYWDLRTISCHYFKVLALHTGNSCTTIYAEIYR